MNRSAQEKFDLIVSKSPEEFAVADVEFLRARRGYLNPVQCEILGDVLGLTPKERKLSKAQSDREPDEVVEEPKESKKQPSKK